ncbi:MAG: SDR family NAD(P)-dependent oxidoreductase, partial [Myxococcales bacterium]|nr:SDR family NAD(P)-dependent oxidoreductase [Myxococcales bacterium]
MLRDKVIVITGAARGVGLACASRFASQGALLLLNDVGCDVTGHGAAPGLMEEVAAQLRARGAQVESDGRDITEQGVPEALCELAAARFGRLDGVVSCAGVVERARFGRTSD